MREVFLTTLLALFVAAGCSSRAPMAAPLPLVVSIGDGDTIRVIEGGKRITVRLACIDAPELAQAPYGETGPANYLPEPLKDRPQAKVHLLSQDRWIAMAAPWPKVTGAVNLNLAMVETGCLCVPEVPRPMRREGLSPSRIQGQPAPLWRWQCLAESLGPGTFDAAGRSSRSAADSRSVPAGRRYRCSETAPIARAQELLRP